MLITPVNGNAMMGSSAVAGNGIASVAHHTAIKTPTEATICADRSRPEGSNRKKKPRNAAKPAIMPVRFKLELSVVLSAILEFYPVELGDGIMRDLLQELGVFTAHCAEVVVGIADWRSLIDRCKCSRSSQICTQQARV